MWRAARPWLAVLLVAALAFAGALSGFEWHRADVARSRLHDAQAAAAVRQQVMATAAAAGTALFTYDYRDLAATQARILSLATGAFAQRESGRNAAVQEELRRERATGSAVVQQVAVSDVSAGQANALVVVDTRSSTAAGGPSTGVVYLHMSLVEVGGEWKVADLQSLNPSG